MDVVRQQVVELREEQVTPVLSATDTRVVTFVL